MSTGPARVRARAELDADEGRAASSEELFRSPQLLAAEGVTHSLRVETDAGELVAPLIVRPIPGAEAQDAISPYGYPGIVPAKAPATPAGADCSAPLAHDQVDWSATGLISIFLRGTALGPHPLAGSERSSLQISDPSRPRKSRMSDRQQIRRNEGRGYEVATVPGPEATPADRGGFHRVYEETMRRTAAAERYLFGAEWFEAVLSSPRARLVVVRAPGREGVAAAAIGALSDGVLHYFLSGTGESWLRDAPMKNAIVALQELSEQLDAPLNLGGGLRPGDGLEEFKRGFANLERPYVTHEIVCDRPAYERLAQDRETTFFPAYRA